MLKCSTESVVGHDMIDYLLSLASTLYSHSEAVASALIIMTHDLSAHAEAPTNTQTSNSEYTHDANSTAAPAAQAGQIQRAVAAVGARIRDRPCKAAAALGCAQTHPPAGASPESPASREAQRTPSH